jgi:hypothetical protein
MTIPEMNANPNLPTAIKCNERGTICASCKAHARWVILTAAGERWATACENHRNFWIRRAAKVAAETAACNTY